MGIIDAVKKGFGVATKNLGLVLIVVIFNLIWNLASMPFTAEPGANVSPQLGLTALALSLVFVLISLFVQGGSLALIRDYMKEGKARLGTFASYGAKYYMKLFLLGLLIILIIAIAALVAMVLVLATSPLNNTGISITAGAVALIIGGLSIYYMILLAMAPYSIVCEDAGVIAAMKKSVKVVRGAIGRVILLLIVIMLISLGVGFLGGLLAGLIGIAVPATAGKVVIGVISSIINGYFGITMMACLMIFYLALTGKQATA